MPMHTSAMSTTCSSYIEHGIWLTVMQSMRVTVADRHGGAGVTVADRIWRCEGDCG